MKYLFLTLILIIATSFTRGNYQVTPVKVKDSLMDSAVIKTNSKVDSIFETASKPITFEEFNKGLLSLMNHMDTIQAAYFIAKKQADSIDNERHTEYIGKISAIEAYYKVQEKYEESKRINEWRDKSANIFFAFIGSFSGVAFFSGVFAGIKKRKRNISKLKDEN